MTEQARAPLDEARAASEQARAAPKQARAVPEQARAAPELRKAALELGKAAPELGKTAPGLGKAAPELGKAAQEQARAALELGEAAPELEKAAQEQAAPELGKEALGSLKNMWCGVCDGSISHSIKSMWSDVGLCCANRKPAPSRRPVQREPHLAYQSINQEREVQPKPHLAVEIDGERAAWTTKEAVRQRLRSPNVVLERYSLLEGYNYARSTRDSYTVAPGDPGGRLTGPYKEHRARLDDAYHGRYHTQRQAFQDTLIREMLATGHSSAHPWIIFTAGPMGAGKGHVVDWMHRADFFLRQNVVHCDPDLLKSAFPEWPGYVERDRLSAGTMCHRESGMVVEVATEAALARGMHCWVDGSLKDGAWYRRMIEDIHARYPHYSIAIIEVQAEREVILDRVAKRAAATGRDVPLGEVESSIASVPKSVALLCDVVDFYARFDNSSENGAPTLTKYCDADVCYVMRQGEHVDRGWQEIGRRFGVGSWSQKAPAVEKDAALARRGGDSNTARLA